MAPINNIDVHVPYTYQAYAVPKQSKFSTILAWEEEAVGITPSLWVVCLSYIQPYDKSALRTLR